MDDHAPLLRRSDPEFWIRQVFSAKAVSAGGVVRRSRAWVDREIGFERFLAEVRARGFHLLQCGPQLIVICHHGRLTMIC